MITETQTILIVLQLTDELFAQLHPFMAGLQISVTPYAARSLRAEQQHLRLTMRAEVYEVLAERVGSALDYDVRWRSFKPHSSPLNAWQTLTFLIMLLNSCIFTASVLTCET
jgi:hypothetical protein